MLQQSEEESYNLGLGESSEYQLPTLEREKQYLVLRLQRKINISQSAF